MSRARARLGRTGEDLACRELERRGYVILARRYRTRGGEVDLIARDGTTLVFVEVKTRESEAFGAAAEAVTWRKRQRMIKVAREYLSRSRLVGCRCRFDVVAIRWDGDEPGCVVYQNAFDAR